MWNIKKNTVKEVKMHNFLVCAYKSQDFAQNLKKFAQSHDCMTVTFRNSAEMNWNEMNWTTLRCLQLHFNALIYDVVYLEVRCSTNYTALFCSGRDPLNPLEGSCWRRTLYLPWTLRPDNHPLDIPKYNLYPLVPASRLCFTWSRAAWLELTGVEF